MRKTHTHPGQPLKHLFIVLVAMSSIINVSVSADDSDVGKAGGIDDAQTVSVTAQRDPFWPVGYQPKRRVAIQSTEQAATVMVEESTDWDRAMGQIAIQGVSSKAGNEFYAIINGQIKSMGETVTILVGEINYTWMIESISPPSSVKLRRLSAQ